MDLFLVFILFFGGLFTVAFGMAWTIPLESRHSKTASSSPLQDVVDLLLVLYDLIPIFFMFDLLKQAPEDYSAAKKKWKSEGGIRASFYISIISAIVTVGSNYCLFIA